MRIFDLLDDEDRDLFRYPQCDSVDCEEGYVLCLGCDTVCEALC